MSNISIETVNAISATSSTGATANSKGGNVTLIANPNLSVVSTLTRAAINVDGKGTSDGGTIKIWANGTLNIGTAAGALSLSAKGDPAGKGNGGIVEVGYTTNLTTTGTVSVAGGAGTGSNAKGGTIKFHDIYNLIVGTTIFDAAAQGDGQGGTVSLKGVALVDFSQLTVNANASSTGKGLGGIFEGSSANDFDILSQIHVDGGKAANYPVSNFYGSIELNGKLCQQWYLQSNWPITYWDCVNPTTPTPTDQILKNFALGLQSATKTQLSSGNTQLFIFNDGGAFNSFWAPTNSADSTTTGVTFGNLSPGHLYVNIFENAQLNNVYGPLSDQNITETAAHELGHAIDNVNNVESLVEPYVTYVYYDFINLDYVTIGVDAAHSTPRPPCSGLNPPFANVNDSAGNPICTGGVLTNSSLSSHSNSYIAQFYSAHIFTPDPASPVPRFGELYAQTVAYRGYADIIAPSLFLDKPADGLFLNNQFACTQGLANIRLNQASGQPAYCSSPWPNTWYQPFK